MDNCEQRMDSEKMAEAQDYIFKLINKTNANLSHAQKKANVNEDEIENLEKKEMLLRNIAKFLYRYDNEVLKAKEV